jgi:WD40 repeat protein
MANSKKTKSARLRRITAIAAAGLIIAAGLFVFLFRDEIGGLLGAGNGADRGTAWTFEAGASQVFAAAGNGLATASSTGLQLLDADGYTVVRSICSLDTPALAVSDKLAAAFDIGGKTLRVADFDANVTEMDTEGVIISVTMNRDGFMAVTTSEAGYKGLVTVYDPSLQAIYEWYSGEGYPLTACVSPDGKSLATLTADADGGRVHIFSLSSSDEKGTYFAEGELLFDLGWMDSGRLCAVSETRAVFIDGTGEAAGEYGFGGMYLTDYSFGGSGFLTLVLSKYLSANASVMITVGDSGEQLGQTDTSSELKGISVSGKQVLAYYSDGLALYSQTLNRSGGITDVQNLKKALIRPRGDVVMIYTATAQIASP